MGRTHLIRYLILICIKMHSRYISISITDTIVIQEFIYILARIQFTLIILVFYLVLVLSSFIRLVPIQI